MGMGLGLGLGVGQGHVKRASSTSTDPATLSPSLLHETRSTSTPAGRSTVTLISNKVSAIGAQAGGSVTAAQLGAAQRPAFDATLGMKTWNSATASLNLSAGIVYSAAAGFWFAVVNRTAGTECYLAAGNSARVTIQSDDYVLIRDDSEGDAGSSVAITATGRCFVAFLNDGTNYYFRSNQTAKVLLGPVSDPVTLNTIGGNDTQGVYSDDSFGIESYGYIAASAATQDAKAAAVAAYYGFTLA